MFKQPAEEARAHEAAASAELFGAAKVRGCRRVFFGGGGPGGCAF